MNSRKIGKERIPPTKNRTTRDMGRNPIYKRNRRLDITNSKVLKKVEVKRRNILKSLKSFIP